MSEPRVGLVGISWDEESYPLTEWPVYGHLSDEEAIGHVQDDDDLQDEVDRGDRETMPALGECVHTFGAWVPATDDDGEPIEGLRWECPVDAGGDAFPVTIVYDLDELAYRRKQRADQVAREEEIRAIILRWLPEATIIRAHGYPTDGGHAEFTLPEMEGPVHWDAKTGKVSARKADHDAWNRLYRGRDTAPGKAPKEAT